MTVVKKRHPRRAIWLGRLADYGVPVTALVAAVLNALVGTWEVVPPWFLVGILTLVYQHRIAQVWSWGWRNGQEETLRRVMPHVPVDCVNILELHDALMAKGPTWRQYQDELSQIDVKATTQATNKRLEKLFAKGQDEEAGRV